MVRDGAVDTQIDTQLKCNANRKSRGLSNMTLNDIESHFRCLKLFCLPYRRKYNIHELRYVYTGIS